MNQNLQTIASVDELLDIQAACAFFKVSKSTLFRYRAKGLKSIKFGKKIFFEKSMLTDFLQQSIAA
jgi:hypothetical protein